MGVLPRVCVAGPDPETDLVSMGGGYTSPAPSDFLTFSPARIPPTASAPVPTSAPRGIFADTTPPPLRSTAPPPVAPPFAGSIRPRSPARMYPAHPLPPPE